MRFVVMGAGGVGGVIGARLRLAGADVVLIARGVHLAAIRSAGLRVQSPHGDDVVAVPAVGAPAEVTWRDGDVVLLSVKSQDTDSALDALVMGGAPRETPIVCAQNGVENERRALRRFRRVSGMCVMLPAAHAEPGVVQCYGVPHAGILDVGRFPSGCDHLDHDVTGALRGAGFASEAVPDVMRWKHAKLLMNLGNAVEAACAPSPESAELAARAYEEGAEVLRTARIPFASTDEDRARRGDLVRLRPIAGRRRDGGSTWQSLARGGSVETDYLNGEIVLLGRLHGVPTPVNALLQEVVGAMAAEGAAPGTRSVLCID